MSQQVERKTDCGKVSSFGTLREKAEKLLENTPDEEEYESAAHEAMALVHDLRVHQAELEIQNEELRRAQSALETSRDEFADLYHQSPAGYVTLNTDMIVTRLNRTFSRMIGDSADVIKGVNFGKLVTPEDWGVFYPRIKQLVKRKKELSMEVRLLPRRSVPFWADLKLRIADRASEDDDSGDRILATITDIDRRKKAEKKLKQSEARFRDISHSMADWIWEVDRDWRYTYTAGKLEKMLGYTPHEILGKKPFDLMEPQEAARVSESFENAAFAGEPLMNFGNLCVGKDGSTICLMTNGFPLIGKKGEIMGYRGVNIDITERIEAEKERRNYTRELEAFNEAMLEREMRIIEMKEEVNRLSAELGRPAPYPPVWKEGNHMNLHCLGGRVGNMNAAPQHP